jgi:3-oxoacyl-[acyl-carrier-protein] synthase III
VSLPASDALPGPDGPSITPSRSTAYTRIASVGSHRPARVVTNDEICQVLDSSDEWIRDRTGIVSRRFAAASETVTDIAEPAARSALERAGLAAGDVDVVLVATVTHLQQTPSAAALLAHRIGATPAAAMDVSVACSGFCHALSLADGLIRAGTATHVLVVGVEKLSDIVDPRDRSTAFIFGDGAGAVVVTAAADHEEPGIGPTIWGSDGGRGDVIMTPPWASIRSGELETPGFDIGCDVSTEIAASLETTQDVAPVPPTLRMQGQAVFRWAIWEMAPVARKALAEAGIEPGDLAAFIPHQANLRIIDALAKQIGIPAHVAIARDVVTSGNTSGASVPLAMDALLTQQPELSGGLALLIGYGAGLSYAAQVVRLP